METPKEGQRKRSKRHRINRNKISDKQRVESCKEFAVWAQEVNRKYKAKLDRNKETRNNTRFS